MKTRRLVLFLFLCGFGSFSWALTDIQISGELGFAAEVYQLPTGQRGTSAFLVPSFVLGVQAGLSEGNLLIAEFEGAEKRQTANQQFDVYSRSLYMDLISLFQGESALRLGLIPNMWLTSQYEDWGYRFLGTSGKSFTEKYRYTSFSDLGLVYLSVLPGAWGEWAFSLANGEGAEKAETGPNKEFGLFWRSTNSDAWTLALSYVRGSYEGMDDSFSKKERIQGAVSYHAEDRWTAGLEILDTHDPAEAIRDLKMADGVEVTSWLGQSVHGQGASLFVDLNVGLSSKVMARYDYLKPTANLSPHSMTSALLGYGYQVTTDIRSVLLVDYSQYPDGYGSGVRDQSKLEFATQVLF